MGIGIYVGTLTRYYADALTEVRDQLSLLSGLPPATAGAPQKQEDIHLTTQNAIRLWREGLTDKLAELLGHSINLWPDDENQPSWSTSPNWDSCCALLLSASCLYLQVPIPPHIIQGRSVSEYEEIQRAGEAPLCSPPNMLYSVELWLPFDEPLIAEYSDLYGDKQLFGTLGSMRENLNWMNDMLWKASPEEILSWKTVYAPPATEEENEHPRRLINRLTPPVALDTADLTRYAYAHVYEAYTLAERYHLPIKLDY